MPSLNTIPVAYYILKFLLQFFYRAYYTLRLRGVANLPKGQPVIIATNHTNAFIDPTIFAMTLRREVFFFARSDVFNTPFKAWVMGRLNIGPMYRIQEGFSEVKKNDKTFELCRKLLSNNGTIILYPEGICILERRIRKLKKGLARIAFQTAESLEFKKDIWVVPVGMNYSDAKKFGSKLFMEVGQAISMRDYHEQYRTDKVKAINDFTRLLEERMKELVVIIEKPENDALVVGLEEICLGEWMKAKRKHSKDLASETELRKEIAVIVNRCDREQPELIVKFREAVSGYMNKLKQHNLRDHLLRKDNIEAMSGLGFINDFLLLWFGTPIYWIGWLLNFPPYCFARSLSDKKVKNVEFYASMYSNIAMFIWVIYYGLQLLTVALLFRSWPLLGGYAVAVPFLFWYVLLYAPVMKKILGRFRLMRMVRKNKKVVEELILQRGLIAETMEKLRTA